MDASDWPWMVDGARAIVEDIENIARESLSTDNFVEGERAYLEQASKQMRSAFDHLSRGLPALSTDAQTRVKHGYDVFRDYGAPRDLLEAAAIIGSYGVATSSALAFRGRIAAAKARAVQEPIAADRAAKLETAIFVLVREQRRPKLSGGIKFAEQIRLAVRAKLGRAEEGDDYPAAKTIKTAILAIKKRSHP